MIFVVAYLLIGLLAAVALATALALNKDDPISLFDDGDIAVGVAAVVIIFLGFVIVWPAGLAVVGWIKLQALLDGKTPSEPTSPENVICRMVDLRMAKDKRIRNGPRPGDWMIWQLWTSPEGVLLRTFTRALWHQDSGLSAADAWARICPSAADEISKSKDADQARRLGAAAVLKAIDPPYLELGDELIGAVLAHATEWAEREVKAVKTGKPYPPLEWLSEELSFDEYVSELFAEPRKDTSWSRSLQDAIDLKHLFSPVDKIWRYKSPPETWRSLGGRAGFALVRDGRPIAAVVTMMN